MLAEFVVSTHSRPKAAGGSGRGAPGLSGCFNSQPPEGGWQSLKIIMPMIIGFNSQPPEGGWIAKSVFCWQSSLFQLTAARRRLVVYKCRITDTTAFQLTAARRRLEFVDKSRPLPDVVSTHSRPKAAGLRHHVLCKIGNVSTHSRPKAAGYEIKAGLPRVGFQLTAARRRLVTISRWRWASITFQLTAARRRLGCRQ